MERIAVFSDSHGDFYSLRRAVEHQLEKSQLFVFCGDGLKDWEKLQFLYPSKQFLAVRGNCDFGYDAPVVRMTEFAGKRILLAHGHTFYVKSGLSLLQQSALKNQAERVLFGHTHLSQTSYEEGIWYVNPGSIGASRDGRKTYAFVDFPSGSMAPSILPAP